MNSFPPGLERRAHYSQMGEEVFESLGCKRALTRDFIQIVFIAIQIFDHKQGKYGSGNIAEFGETGVLIRATDKIKRLGNLWRTGQEPKDETKDDSWGDLANYGLIALMCRWGLWPGVEKIASKDPGRREQPERGEAGIPVKAGNGIMGDMVLFRDLLETTRSDAG